MNPDTHVLIAANAYRLLFFAIYGIAVLIVGPASYRVRLTSVLVGSCVSYVVRLVTVATLGPEISFFWHSVISIGTGLIALKVVFMMIDHEDYANK